MAFTFRDLSVTLTTSFIAGEPRAELIVQTCGTESLRVLYGTCGTSTQPGCNTRPQDMRRLTPLMTGGLQELQNELEELIRRFGPGGTPSDESTSSDTGDAERQDPQP